MSASTFKETPWYTIRLGAPERVADVPAPNRHQAISNHHSDCSVSKESHSDIRIVLRHIHSALQPLNKQCSREFERSTTRRFLCLLVGSSSHTKNALYVLGSQHIQHAPLPCLICQSVQRPGYHLFKTWRPRSSIKARLITLRITGYMHKSPSGWLPSSL